MRLTAKEQENMTKFRFRGKRYAIENGHVIRNQGIRVCEIDPITPDHEMYRNEYYAIEMAKKALADIREKNKCGAGCVD